MNGLSESGESIILGRRVSSYLIILYGKRIRSPQEPDGNPDKMTLKICPVGLSSE